MSDNITLPREVAYEVPLHELLESVPSDARLVIDDADGKGTRFIPVGRLCREAATALRTHLAAPRPEPVAYFDLQKQVFFWAKPTMIDVPMTVALNPLPLYAAPPAAAPSEDIDALRRDAERYKWLRGEHSRIDPCIKAVCKHPLQRQGHTWAEIHDLDAIFDAAMEDKT